LLIPVVVLNSFPIATTRKNSATKFWSFKASVFEDYCASIAMPSISNVQEAFLVAFEMEEELQGLDGEGEVRLGPCWKVRSSFIEI
jgi:hypothetical protein